MDVLILDTDLLTILFRGPTPSRTRLLAWLDDADDDVAVTIISFEEQMRGWLAVIARASAPEQQSAAYARLKEVLSNFNRLPVLDFDVLIATDFRELRRTYRRHGAADLKIAAIALGNGAKLLSRNIRDFQSIDGLVVENPLA